ncbi:MAG: 2'-5' RNA ligase family protein [Ruegeria sp.]
MTKQLPLFDRLPLGHRPNRARPSTRWGQHHLFFALFPPKAAVDAIVDRRRRLRSGPGPDLRELRPDRLHVTLHFVERFKDVPQWFVNAACKAASTVAFEPFEVCFDRALTFRGRPQSSPVVLLSQGENVPLSNLRLSVISALFDAGFSMGPVPKFTPHITLTYGSGFEGERRIEPVRWRVTEFVLIQSLQGKTRYIPLDRWQAGGGPTH